MTYSHTFGASNSPKSAAKINTEGHEEQKCRAKDAAARCCNADDKAGYAGPGYITEHQPVKSRTTGRTHEIQFGPNGGGLVPANPFASLAQEGFLHAHPEKLGKKALAEWDRETKGKKLPKKVKK